MSWPKAFSNACQAAGLVLVVWCCSQCAARQAEAEANSKRPQLIERTVAP